MREGKLLQSNEPIATLDIQHKQQGRARIGTELNKPRNNLVGNLVAIFHPVVSIFLAASIVIAEGTVDQQDGEIDHIEIRPDQTSVPGW